MYAYSGENVLFNNDGTRGKKHFSFTTFLMQDVIDFMMFVIISLQLSWKTY